MATYCVDQNELRKDLVRDKANEGGSIFLLTEAAVLEMCKSASNWKTTLQASLLSLAAHPEKVVCAHGAGTCFDLEMQVRRPLGFGDLVCPRRTEFLRNILLEIAARLESSAFREMEAELDRTRKQMESEVLNHDRNKRSAIDRIESLRPALPDKLLSDLRAGRLTAEEKRSLVTSIAIIQIAGGCSEKLNFISRQSAAVMLEHCSFAFRSIWIKLRSTFRWAEQPSRASVDGSKVTNDDLDAQYVIMGSYCDALLSKDKWVQQLDGEMRQVIGHDSQNPHHGLEVFERYYGAGSFGSVIRHFHSTPLP